MLPGDRVTRGAHCLPRVACAGDALSKLNVALKTKWLWKFAEEESTVWKQLMKEKYGFDDLGWWTKRSMHVLWVGCWKS